MKTYDYVIIGAGVYGCGLAWELATAGAAVALLEKSSIAAGSSGGAGARGVRSDFRDLREMALARRALELWPDLDERLGESTGYQQLGGLRLVENEYVGGKGGRVSLQAHAWMQNRAGIPTQILTRDELLNLEPGISESVTHALYVPRDGTAPHERTTLALAAAAQRAGVDLLLNSPVLDIEWAGDGISAVHTPTGSFVGRRGVVVTANAATGTILGERNPVPGWAVIPQATFVRPVRRHSLSHLVNHESRPLSMKAGPEGTVQLSGGMRGRWDPVTGRAVVDESLVALSLSHASAVYPELEAAEIVASEAGGPELCSPDGIPVIDRLPGSTSTYLASHWTAHGFALFPAVVEALRQWLLEGYRPPVLEPFSVSRFGVAAETSF